MRKTNEVSLKLSAKGEAALKKALRETGEEGKKMAALIERSGRKAGRGLKVVDEGAKEVKRSVEGMNDRLGPAGALMKALGPAGLAAGAGIAAVAASIGVATRISTQAVHAFSDMGHAADKLGLHTDTFQAITFEMSQMGIAQTQLDTGMKALAERQSQIITQQGEMYSRLKDTNPELLKQLAAMDSQEDRLRAVLKAMKEAETQSERNMIAFASFGESGEQLKRVFTSMENGLDGSIEKAREMGLVIDESLIRRSQEMADEMAIAHRILDLQLKQAFIDFAPIALDGAEALAEFAKWLGEVSDGMRDVADRSTATLENRLQALKVEFREAGLEARDLEAAIKGLRALDETDAPFQRSLLGAQYRGASRTEIDEFNAIAAELRLRGESDRAAGFFDSTSGLNNEAIDAQVAAFREQLDALEAEIQAEVDRRVQGTEAGFLNPVLRKGIEGQVNLERGQERAALNNNISALERRRNVNDDLAAEANERKRLADEIERQRQAEANKKKQDADALRLERERVQMRKQAAVLALELGDATEALALKEAELTKLVERQFLTQEQADETLKRYRDRVTGVTAATERWMSVVEGAETPLEKLQQSLADLQSDAAAGVFGENAEAATLYLEALEALTKGIEEAESAEEAAKPAYKEAAEIRRKLAEARQASKSEAQLLFEAESKLNALVASGNLSREDAVAYLELYRDKLSEARGEIDLLSEAESLLDGVMSQRIKTTEDALDAIGRLILETVRQAAMAQAQLGGGGGFGGFVSGIFGSIFGGSGSGAAGTPGITGPITPAPISHRGSIIGMPPREWRDPRQGLAANEQLTITERGQELVPQDDRRQIIDFIRDRQQPAYPMMAAIPHGPIPLAISMSIRHYGGGGQSAEVTATQSGPNDLELSVLIGDQVAKTVAEGGVDEALVARGFQKVARR